MALNPSHARNATRLHAVCAGLFCMMLLTTRTAPVSASIKTSKSSDGLYVFTRIRHAAKKCIGRLGIKDIPQFRRQTRIH